MPTVADLQNERYPGTATNTPDLAVLADATAPSGGGFIALSVPGPIPTLHGSPTNSSL